MSVGFAWPMGHLLVNSASVIYVLSDISYDNFLMEKLK